MTFVLITAMNFSFLSPERKAKLSERLTYPAVFEALKLRL
jgi:hypothetical protein